MDRRSSAPSLARKNREVTIPLSIAGSFSSLNLARHPLLVSFEKKEYPAPETVGAVQRYFAWAAQSVGLHELNVDAERHAYNGGGGNGSSGPGGEPHTIAGLVLHDPLKAVQRFAGHVCENPNYRRNNLRDDIGALIPFYEWALKRRLVSFNPRDIEDVIQGLPLTVTQPGRRRVIDIEPTGMQRVQTYHLIRWAVQGIPSKGNVPPEFRYVPPEVPESRSESEGPPLARLSITHVRCLRLGDYDSHCQLIRIPPVAGLPGTILAPTVKFTALLDTVLRLSEPLRRAAWQKELKDTPLILAFDGGSLTIDGQMPANVLAIRDQLIDRLMRKYRFTFEQVVGFRRGDFNPAGGTLSLLDEERGTRCFSLDPITLKALRRWTEFLDKTCHSNIEPEAKKLLPLIPGGDGRHLTADSAIQLPEEADVLL